MAVETFWIAWSTQCSKLRYSCYTIVDRLSIHVQPLTGGFFFAFSARGGMMIESARMSLLYKWLHFPTGANDSLPFLKVAS